MNSRRLTRRAAAAIGISAALSAAVLTACGGGQSGGPSTTSTTTTTSSVSPTEKSINPTGGNLFSPAVTAPGAPTVTPGDHDHTG